MRGARQFWLALESDFTARAQLRKHLALGQIGRANVRPEPTRKLTQVLVRSNHGATPFLVVNHVRNPLRSGERARDVDDARPLSRSELWFFLRGARYGSFGDSQTAPAFN